MTELNSYKYFYFLGIGGIGMSALARYFNSKGFEVVGYDKTPTELTDELIKEGISIHFEDEISAIPAHFKAHKDEVLVTYTPAIPKDHIEYNYLLQEGFTIKKRAEVLAAITMGKYSIAVAGTHGKTSTASMIAHILKTAEIPFYAFLGGIAANYKTNYLEPDKGKESNLVVVEADEFDRSFLQLTPDVAIITAIESDHLDIYGTEENLKEAFFEFAKKVPAGGNLIVNVNTKIEEPEEAAFETYSAISDADIKTENIVVKNGKYHFDLLFGNRNFRLNDLEIGVPGVHNIENSLAAVAATYALINEDTIFHNALKTFKGVHRRFEIVFKNNEVVYIDDYAHHPTEIKVTLQTIKELYPNKKLLGIFQPHLFTRTRDLAKDFAASLSLVDELILMPIYPARELPIPGITSQIILDEVHCAKKQILDSTQIIKALESTDAKVIVTLGAGDIDRLVQPIHSFLENKYGNE